MTKFNLTAFKALAVKYGFEARENNSGFKVLEDLGNLKMRLHTGKFGMYGFIDMEDGTSVLIGVKGTVPEGEYMVNIKVLELLKDYEGKSAGYVWAKGYLVVSESEKA